MCVCSISTDDFMARFVDREKQGEGQVNQTIICQIIFFFSKKKNIYIYIYITLEIRAPTKQFFPFLLKSTLASLMFNA